VSKQPLVVYVGTTAARLIGVLSLFPATPDSPSRQGRRY